MEDGEFETIQGAIAAKLTSGAALDGSEFLSLLGIGSSSSTGGPAGSSSSKKGAKGKGNGKGAGVIGKKSKGGDTGTVGVKLEK